MPSLVYLDHLAAIAMANGLTNKKIFVYEYPGECQDSFRNPGAGTSRNGQDNGREYIYLYSVCSVRAVTSP